MGGRQSAGEGGGELREQHWHMPTATREADSGRGAAASTGAQRGALGWPGGLGWRVGGRLKRERRYVCLCLVHIVVQQKLTQY